MQNAKCKMQNAKCKMQGARCKVQVVQVKRRLTFKDFKKYLMQATSTRSVLSCFIFMFRHECGLLLLVKFATNKCKYFCPQYF
jgi:hypothetical protein